MYRGPNEDFETGEVLTGNNRLHKTNSALRLTWQTGSREKGISWVVGFGGNQAR